MKIVVSITPKSIEEVSALSPENYKGADLIEWRADYLPVDLILEAAPLIFDKFSNHSLIFTIRTVEEGGNIQLEEETYLRLIEDISKSYTPAYLDVQYFTYPNVYAQVVSLGQVVLSYHDFSQLPADFSQRCQVLTDLKPAIVKIAVMPQKEMDVLQLMTWTREFKTQNPKQAYVTMAMGSLGRLSRLGADLSGSAWSFASVGKASAPGQVSLEDLLQVRRLLDAD
ncbi:type I 3-dehydroquinate dehydratase [Streptococcus sp. DD12]|uniref:type I 3-dehydroquinate dehydratase n=1 Tax=Streptococcus sp. DD12 TaxID=1777880 RepID=UPI00079650FD|nr:type I 3-dehydroquinate dehydratase [Streptococcus sp. DD12]KXT76868.1 3-dehydroquinate dehydratase I [Streptococcus sp. DD12]